MYNSATKSYTLQDASGSYSWIVESLDAADYQTMTDAEINAWIDSLISTAKDYDVAEIESRAESQEYPRYGYTTADVYENAETCADKLAEIDSDYADERETVFQFIKSWIAEGAQPKTRKQLIEKIEKLIENGYGETYVGFHSEYRFWHGTERRGCYAQIAEPYGGTKRIYEHSYQELYTTIFEYVNG